MSKISALLRSHNVRLIGIGFEDNNWEDFKNRGFFDGELYADPLRETYTALGFRTYQNYCCMLLGLAHPKSIPRILVGTMKHRYNLWTGDPKINGGCIVVTQGGASVPFLFRQDLPSDQVDIGKALGITESAVAQQPTNISKE